VFIKLSTMPWRHRGVEVIIPPLLATELDVDQLHAPAASPPNPPVRIGLEAGWAPESLWTLWRQEKSSTDGNRTWAIQTVAHRYTDWIILTLYVKNRNKLTGMGTMNIENKDVNINVHNQALFQPPQCFCDSKYLTFSVIYLSFHQILPISSAQNLSKIYEMGLTTKMWQM
jgi:hypothetical protein